MKKSTPPLRRRLWRYREKLTGFIHVVRDIAAREKRRKSSRNSKARLNQVQKMDSMGCLVGGIAHDFKNILSVLIALRKN